MFWRVPGRRFEANGNAGDRAALADLCATGTPPDGRVGPPTGGAPRPAAKPIRPGGTACTMIGP
jgi:hypothetical protein